jgi:hypothetical protein
VSLLGVPDRVEESLLQNRCRSWTSQSTGTLAVVTDRHTSPYSTFIYWWISMGFTPSLLKKRMTDAVLLSCMLQAGPPFLHYYCAFVLHSCIVLPHVGHSSKHKYHYCQLTRQSSCV